MLDTLYTTRNNYVFNKFNHKMIKISSRLYSYLQTITHINDIDLLYKQGNLNLSEYQTFNSFLFDKSYKRDEINYTKLDKLQLIVCNTCNLDCKYCYANKGTYNIAEQFMDFNTAKLTIDIFFSKYSYINNISFFGGEPTLNIDTIEQICDYIQITYPNQYGSFIMMTNMYHINNKILKVVKKHNINVSTSLDGNEYENDFNRIDKFGNGTYKQVVKNIFDMRKRLNQPKSIEITYSDVHINESRSEIEIISELNNILGVKGFSVSNVINFYGGSENFNYDNSFTIKEKIINFINTGTFDPEINRLYTVISGKNSSNMFCNAGINQITIMPNGDIYPCQLYVLDRTEKYKMGNASTFCHDKFNNSQNRLTSMLKDQYSNCVNCSESCICFSCLGSSIVNNIKLPKSNEDCLQTKKNYDLLIEVYAEIYDDSKLWNNFISRIKEFNINEI